jgi:ABC-2 type transport system ATP-binding protein
LIFPTSGGAYILGKSIEDISVHSRIGYLPENPYFYDHLTPEEFLNYAGQLFGLSASDRRARSRRLLERVGLTEARRIPLRKFSKGMVQRLGIAQTLINDPELIFLDEPMSGLDPLGRHEVRDLILELRREGKTIFFSTHILSDAEALCDRVGILHRGRWQGCGELHEILSVGAHTTEVVLENPKPEVLSELNSYTTSVVRTGDRVRLEIPTEADVATVLEVSLRRRAKILSVNPVKMSLEDYFMAHVAPVQDPVRRQETRTASGGGVKER